MNLETYTYWVKDDLMEIIKTLSINHSYIIYVVSFNQLFGAYFEKMNYKKKKNISQGPQIETKSAIYIISYK